MKKYLSILSVLLLFVIAGCGGESNESNQQEAEASSGNSDSQARTIDVYGTDHLKFVVKEQADYLQTGQETTVNGETYYELNGITSQAGQELTIKLHAVSQLPPTAMSHNWLLLKQNADAQAFANASGQAKDNDYVAQDMLDQVITDTGLVGGGESKSVTFTVPEQTGEYDYICTFPGHFSSGMRGTLTVE